jgi:hypothetical protein
MSTFNWEGQMRLPPRPWPWERKVTVCIAALCTESKRKIFVLCSDLKGGTEIGSAQTIVKQWPLAHGFYCLSAGDDVEIYATVRLIKKHLKQLQKVDETNAKVAVENALAERKSHKVNTLILGRFAMPYNQFIDIGKEKFPEDAFRRTMLDVEDMKINATFIVVGFPDNFPMIIQTEQDTTAHIREDFAAVGEGCLLAQSALLYRNHIDTANLHETIYCVYEAKRAAERIGSVGELTMLRLLYPNGENRRQVFHRMKELDGPLANFGPKSIPDDFKIDLEALFYDSPDPFAAQSSETQPQTPSPSHPTPAPERSG